MRILAADTSTSVNTVALCEDGRILAETYVECGRSHAERLIQTVEWVLKESALDTRRIDALAISIGPGSFTGLRVGAAAWKGLALGAGLPLVGVPTLDAMTRQGAFGHGIVCPLLDAKMQEVFGAAYRFVGGRREKLMPDRVCPVEDLLADLESPALFFGEGAELYRDRIHGALPGAVILDDLHRYPRASAVAAEAFDLLEAGCETDPARVAPVYLRAAQAERARAAT
jgi:tRNA threonylcarbamoyladenosine biosynthesis protein TsaB